MFWTNCFKRREESSDTASKKDEAKRRSSDRIKRRPSGVLLVTPSALGIGDSDASKVTAGSKDFPSRPGR